MVIGVLLQGCTGMSVRMDPVTSHSPTPAYTSQNSHRLTQQEANVVPYDMTLLTHTSSLLAAGVT